MLKKDGWISTILFISAFFLSSRYWFFNSKIILGHNWDFTFPAVDAIGTNTGSISNYMWSDFTGPTLMLQSLIVNNNIYSIFVEYLGTSITIKVIYLIMMLTGYLGFSKLIKYYYGLKDLDAKILGIFYAFSPYAFSIIIGGSWNAWISYAFSPYLLFILLKIFIDGGINYCWALIPTTVLTIGFPQYFLIVNIIFITLIIIQANREKKYLVYIKKSIYLIAFYISINLYWLIPFLYHFGEFNQSIYKNIEITSFKNIENSLQTPENIFYLTGFNNRNFYLNSIGHYVILYIASLTTLISIILYSYFFKKDVEKIEPLGLLFVLFFILSSGGSGLLGSLNIAIHESIGIFKMYRNPQNMFFSIVFIGILILAKAVSKINSRKITLILTFCLPFYIIGWLLNGDFGSSALEKKNLSYVDFFKLSRGIEEMYLFYENVSIENRPFFIPNTQSPRFVKNENQKGGQGGVAEYLYMKKPPYITKNEAILRSAYQTENNNLFIKYLGDKSVRYITVRNDIVDHFNNKPKFYNMLVEAELSKKIKLVKSHENNNIFIVPNIYFRPVISLIDDNKLSNTKSSIEFKKISPVRYDLNLRNINTHNTYIILYNSAYNKNWKISINNPNHIKKNEINKLNINDYYIDPINIYDQADLKEIKSYLENRKIEFPTSLSRPKISFISKEFHNSIQNENIGYKYFNPFQSTFPNYYHIDKYGDFENINGYKIEPSFIIEQYPNAVQKNNDGTFNLSLTIYFKTQYVFYMGIVLSIISLSICLLLRKKILQ